MNEYWNNCTAVYVLISPLHKVGLTCNIDVEHTCCLPAVVCVCRGVLDSVFAPAQRRFVRS